MIDWISYIRENLNNDIWGFIFLDYYYKESYAKYKEDINRYEPEKFIDEEIEKLYVSIKDMVHFHKVFLRVCVQLLYNPKEKEKIETSTELIFSKSYYFLNKNRKSLKEKQIESIIDHYGNLNDEKSYRKKAIFKKYLINKGFLKEPICKSTQPILKKAEKEPQLKPEILDKLMIHQNDLPTVVILTALSVEYEAIRSHLKHISDEDRKGSFYEKGIFELNKKGIGKIIIRECGESNINAAQETERAINYFDPELILFVGIAGSRKPNDFSVGDVIFPNKIISYEGGKSEKDQFRSRPDLANATYRLCEIAKKEKRKTDWKGIIRGNWDTKNIKADLGIIASGEQLIEHYDSEIGKILTAHYDKTQVVEMEGFGFAMAATRQAYNIPFGVIRGISDIIQQSNSSAIIYDRRPHEMKQFASDTAAAFAFWLISKVFDESQQDKK